MSITVCVLTLILMLSIVEFISYETILNNFVDPKLRDRYTMYNSDKIIFIVYITLLLISIFLITSL